MLNLDFLNKEDDIAIHNYCGFEIKAKQGFVIKASIYAPFSENLASIIEQLSEWKLRHMNVFPENNATNIPYHNVVLIFERDIE